MGLCILHCVASVNPVAGGVIEAIRQLSLVNIRAGHRVEVLSLDAPDSQWVKNCPLKCHALGPGRFGAYAFASRYTSWLRANRHHFDVVVINGLWQYHSFGAWRALRGTVTPYVVFSHGMLAPWFKQRYPLKHVKKWLYWPWTEYRVLRDAAAVMFTCEEERRLARQSFWLYRCNEAVVNFGTGRAPESAASQRQAFSSRFPELAGKRCLLFLGRVHEVKGADMLFTAFASLLGQMPGDLGDRLHLVMAGPAENAYGDAMKAMVVKLGIAQRVTWTGMLEGDAKWGALRCADAFVMPSHHENFGVAVVEALACSVPVLISNKVNIWREIEQDGAGFIADDTVEGTLNLLHRWAGADPQTMQAMGTAAADCFARHFDIEQSARDFIDTVEPIVARKRLR